MFAKRFLSVFSLLTIMVMVLTACGSASASAPASAASPTITPVSSMPAPTTAQSGSTFAGLSSGLDNTKQARLRTVSEVWNAPNTDVFINGLSATDGGIAQANIGAGQFSGWLYVNPGTYSLALVPNGGTLAQALFTPTDVKVEAGHRYTVAAMGQLADKNVKPLVVDETTLEAGFGAKNTNNIAIDIDNMAGADGITEEADGKPVAENIKYGEARAMLFAPGTPQFKTVATGKVPGVLGEGSDACEPGTSLVIPWFGPYPAANYDSVGSASQRTSDLNVLDFLAGFKGQNVKMDGHLVEFNTLLAAIDKAGMRDQFINGAPYMFMAPTDEAFAGMSQTAKDALLNDPKALTNLLNAHLVDGYFPFGSLSGATYGTSGRTVANRLGLKLAFQDDFINGTPIGSNYTVGNGYRVQIVFTLLPVK